MSVLVLNAGSSSLKYKLLGADDLRVLHKGLVERIGEADVPDHRAALKRVVSELRNNFV